MHPLQYLLYLMPHDFNHQWKSNMIFTVDKKILPTPKQESQRQTRSSDLNSYRYIIPKFNTSTYQKSYKIRATRIWNNLPSYITSMNLPFRQFKTLLFNYYTLALEETYDVEDPRTWKSVCIKCNSARSLTSLPIACCF